jgi:hypothetical protein
MSRIPIPRSVNALGTSANYIRNGRKPTLDDATALEIKHKADAGATNTALAKAYGVRPQTIRLAIMRAEFSVRP